MLNNVSSSDHYDDLSIHSNSFVLFTLPPLTPNVEPQLNPSHPHHNMNVPSKTLVGHPIIGVFFLPFSNIPILKEKEVKDFETCLSYYF